MMDELLKKILLGYLFVIFEVHIIFVDILPEPVGYYWIYMSLLSLEKMYDLTNKGSKMALLLTFLSIPSMFIQRNNQGVDLVFDQISTYYEPIFTILGVILTFFVFQAMVEVAKEKGSLDIQKRTKMTFSIYMVIMFLNEFLKPFTYNVQNEIFGFALITTMLIGTVVQIVFLFLVFRFRKIEQY